jgi:hypothetical protein
MEFPVLRFNRITVITIDVQIDNAVIGNRNNCNKKGSNEKIPIPAISAMDKKSPGFSLILKSDKNPNPVTVCRKHRKRSITICVIVLVEIG